MTYGDYTVEIKADTLCDAFSLKDLVLTYGPVRTCVGVVVGVSVVYRLYVTHCTVLCSVTLQPSLKIEKTYILVCVCV